MSEIRTHPVVRHSRFQTLSEIWTPNCLKTRCLTLVKTVLYYTKNCSLFKRSRLASSLDKFGFVSENRTGLRPNFEPFQTSNVRISGTHLSGRLSLSNFFLHQIRVAESWIYSHLFTFYFVDVEFVGWFVHLCSTWLCMTMCFKFKKLISVLVQKLAKIKILFYHKKKSIKVLVLLWHFKLL